MCRAAFVFEMLLHEFFNVERKRRRDVNNRAVRRHLEKMVTDVVRACVYVVYVMTSSRVTCASLQAVDVLLEELIPSLNEDMLDLDEYEMGMQENAKPRFELSFRTNTRASLYCAVLFISLVHRGFDGLQDILKDL